MTDPAASAQAAAPAAPAARARPSTLRSSMAISVAVMASRVLGVVRDSLFSALFGAGMLGDAYRVAFQIPNLLRDLFAEGALSSAFVPTFTEALQKDGKARAFRVANLVFTGLLLVTGALVALGWVFSDEIVALISGGFRGDTVKLETTSQLARIMLPILTLVSVSAVFMGMLNAQSRFVAPAMAPALFNVASIAFGGALVVFGVHDRTAVFVFAIGTTVAAVVQAAVQLPSLWRSGYRPALVFGGVFSDPGVRRIVRLMGPAVLGLAAVQVNIFVNTRFASSLGDGAVVCLTNAFRFFYLPIGLFGVALATVTTTRVSEEAARGDRSALVARTVDGTRAVWMLASASSVGLIVLAEPILRLVFEWGRYTHADTVATAAILQAYMLGTLPYSLVKIYAPGFYAVDRPRVPMLASMAAVAANVTFNALTYRRLGAPGLALGTTVAALVNLTILRLAYGRLIGSPRRLRLLAELGALVLANAVLGALAWGGAQVLDRVLDLVPRVGVRLALAAGMFLVIGVAFLVYARVLRALRYPGADELAALPSKLVGKVTGRRRRGPANIQQTPSA